MNFERLFKSLNSSVDVSLSLVTRSVETLKNEIRDVIRNWPPLEIIDLLDRGERPFLGPNELSYDTLFPSEFFCPDTFEVNLQLRFYLSQSFLPKHAVKLEYSCYVLITKLREVSSFPPNQLAAGIQRFYTRMEENALRYGSIDPNFSTTEFLELVESFICVHCYDILFCPNSAEETFDLFLQTRIRSFQWITPAFLDLELKLELEEVDNLIHDAIIELADLNTHKRIKDKFCCLTKCGGKIMEAIEKSTGSSASADEFIPAFIYVILRANPTLINSNTEFMQRFSLKSRVYSGQTAYQFTNLCSAIHFIQELDAQKLRMPEDKFESLVNAYTPS